MKNTNKLKYLPILNNGVRVECMNRLTEECGVAHYAPKINKIAFYSGVSETFDRTMTEEQFINDFIITNVNVDDLLGNADKTPTEHEKSLIKVEITSVLNKSISSEYIRGILEEEINDGNSSTTVMDMIMSDMLETSDWYECKKYTEDDIKLSIGRVLSDLIIIR